MIVYDNNYIYYDYCAAQQIATVIISSFNWSTNTSWWVDFAKRGSVKFNLNIKLIRPFISTTKPTKTTTRKGITTVRTTTTTTTTTIAPYFNMLQKDDCLYDNYFYTDAGSYSIDQKSSLCYHSFSSESITKNLVFNALNLLIIKP